MLHMIYLTFKLTILSKSAKNDGAVASFEVHVFKKREKESQLPVRPQKHDYLALNTKRRILIIH